MDDQRSKIINDLTAELNDYEDKLNTIFKELNWDVDTITEYEKVWNLASESYFE